MVCNSVQCCVVSNAACCAMLCSGVQWDARDVQWCATVCKVGVRSVCVVCNVVQRCATVCKVSLHCVRGVQRCATVCKASLHCVHGVQWCAKVCNSVHTVRMVCVAACMGCMEYSGVQWCVCMGSMGCNGV